MGLDLRVGARHRLMPRSSAPGKWRGSKSFFAMKGKNRLLCSNRLKWTWKTWNLEVHSWGHAFDKLFRMKGRGLDRNFS